MKKDHINILQRSFFIKGNLFFFQFYEKNLFQTLKNLTGSILTLLRQIPENGDMPWHLPIYEAKFECCLSSDKAVYQMINS